MSHYDDQSPNGTGKPKATRKTTGGTASQTTAAATTARRKSSRIDSIPSPLYDGDGMFDSGGDQDLAHMSPDIDMDLNRGDLDVAERFDLGETGKSRSSSREGGSLVETLDEIVDPLYLEDPEELISSPPARGKRGSGKRNGQAAGATAHDSQIEVEVLEITVE